MSSSCVRVWGITTIALLCVISPPVRAQGRIVFDGPPPKEDPGGPRPWWEWLPTDEEFKELCASGKRLSDAVFVLGTPRARAGTAFLISRKHRLLATAAHTADPERMRQGLWAVGGAGVHKVKHVWLHPDIRRQEAEEGTLLGIIDGSSADVAILQLEESGPELPEAFRLACPGQQREVQRRSVATLGFPVHRMPGWPRQNALPLPAIQSGVIVHTYARFRTVERAQYTGAEWMGASGAPVFLRDGTVIGVCTWAGVQLCKGSRDGCVMLSDTCLTDELWKLLAVADGLGDCLTPERDGIRLSEDPARDCRQQRAAEIPADDVNQYHWARRLRKDGTLGEARKLLDRLIEKYPRWADLYTERAAVIGQPFLENAKLSKAEQLRIVRAAHADSVMAMQLDPACPRRHIDVGYKLCWMGYATGDRTCAYMVLHWVRNNWLRGDPPEKIKAKFFALEA
ncbi:MAG: hypothetical protein G01um101438_700 [Parcubacteria group bacterium Gr01-1014_38]|nr:MAG: hypothetical protein G01um101438_700 [Parcubacteria group bacterium Gr01-1014_38]